MTRVIKRILILLSFTVFSFSAFAAEKIKLANGEWAPYQSATLKENGFISQFVKEVFEGEGYEVEYVFLPWKRGFEDTKKGALDGSFLWSKNPEREKSFLYSNPVISLSSSLFQQADKPIVWAQLTDLAKYKIGGVVGYSYVTDKLEKQGVLKIQRIAKSDSNYKKLAAGRLDAVIEDTDVGFEAINRLGLAGKIVPNDKELSAREYFVIISKNSPRAQELLEAFNRGLAKAQAAGKLKQYREASNKGEYLKK
ncbi:transporter substrate-binding domain-containing protein [Vibrio sp. S4M6]|uniref:substrate-binding periplasmic protein n=1 Tax=Vibrio sinus TaxID=2946865 RepID=UPI002029F018|nr:transporter substrate-binding domain-containing protein [Vibrio sinus]MCL9780035.1 transporter substrate-binding domain-containing protein [Vibrio sinus]